MTNAETYMRNHVRHEKARKVLGKVNKAAIFEALAAANITEVLVEFDGEVDSGQIEMLTVVRDGEPVAMLRRPLRSGRLPRAARNLTSPRAPSGKRLRRSVTTSSKRSTAVGKTTTAPLANFTST